MKKVSIILLCVSFLISATKETKTDRRGFFTKIRNAYLQGRYEKEERRIVERREAEKMRRRAVFERNIKKLTDGVSKRLQRGPGHIKLVVVGGVVLVVWLCYKGSVGCDNRKEKD